MQNAWVDRTGQRWKAIATLSAACVLPAIAVLAFAFGLLAAAVTLLAVALLSFIGFAAGIRCPKCHRSVSWMVLISRPSARWLADLFALEGCPSCGAP